MTKLEVIAGPSALTRAADDEPVFVLRANDELAPAVVRCWAAMYYSAKAKGTEPPGEKHLAKFEEALEIAFQMTAYKEAHSE